jgi:hypothetical protein
MQTYMSQYNYLGECLVSECGFFGYGRLKVSVYRRSVGSVPQTFDCFTPF